MEFMSHCDATIHYLPGEKNCAADALSRLPDPPLRIVAATMSTTCTHKIRSRFDLEDALLEDIKRGYETDPFSKKLTSAATGMTNIQQTNGFWFVDDRLLIPNAHGILETLFRLAHDNLGHFGTQKTYETLHASYFWPNMRRDLETAYIPSCADCQRNKSKTSKPIGPLHPLPVPDDRCDSVAINFVGLLPLDEGYNSFVTFTDRLGSDIRIVPTTTTLTAEEFAELFFQHWYCENGLPLEIVSDRDKIFLSRFWKELHKLTGIKLKMSTAYHPKSDGASERTNKTVIQAIQFAVERDQRGWVKTLPKVRFDIMNTVNASTGFTPFQLHFGKPARILPPILPPHHDNEPNQTAIDLIAHMQPLQLEAQDNLLTSKILQAHHENSHRQLSFPFKIGNRVVLSTTNRRCVYKSGDKSRAAKFMPRFDGPYPIIATNEIHSTVTLALPNQSRLFPVFHTSEVKPFHENDNSLFPTRALQPPNPINVDGNQEFFIKRIVDERRRGRRKQYLVRWSGEGPEGNLWLDENELEECEALDVWLAKGGEQEDREEAEGPGQPRLTITIPPRTRSSSKRGGV